MGIGGRRRPRPCAWRKSSSGRTLGRPRAWARFFASTFNGTLYPLGLFELRALDVALSDAALACIDAVRRGKADLSKLLPNG